MDRRGKPEPLALSKTFSRASRMRNVLFLFGVIFGFMALLYAVMPPESEMQPYIMPAAGAALFCLVLGIWYARWLGRLRLRLDVPIQFHGLGLQVALPQRDVMKVYRDLQRCRNSLCHACGEYVANSGATECRTCHNLFHPRCTASDVTCHFCQRGWVIGVRPSGRKLVRFDDKEFFTFAGAELPIVEYESPEQCIACERQVAPGEVDELGVCHGCRTGQHRLRHYLSLHRQGCLLAVWSIVLMSASSWFDESSRYHDQGTALLLIGLATWPVALVLNLVQLLGGLALYAKLKLVSVRSLRPKNYVSIVRRTRDFSLKLLWVFLLAGGIGFVLFGVKGSGGYFELTPAGFAVSLFIACWIGCWAVLHLLSKALY